jgi:hypothetical protein
MQKKVVVVNFRALSWDFPGGTDENYEGSQSETVKVRVRPTLRLGVYRQSLHLGAKPLETHDQYFFQLNPCGHSPYVTSSLTRRWVCHLQLLLVLASVVILGSDFRGTHDHILLPQFRDSPNLEGQVPVFISPRNRVAIYTPRHWVPFSSPPTTRRAAGIRTRVHTS